MRRKQSKLFITLAIGLILLIGTSIVSFANGPSGYDSFKEVLKNQNEVENAKINFDLKVSDNEKDVVYITSVVNADKESEKASGTINILADNVDKSFNFYASEDSAIIKVNDTEKYIKFEGVKAEKIRKMERRNKDHKLTANEEAFMDAIVGDYKNNFNEKQLENGNKEITFSMDEGDVPDIINLLLEAKHEDKMEEKEFAQCTELKNILGICKDDIKTAELETDIKIKSILVKLIVDSENKVKGFGLAGEISGKDADGKTHLLKIDMNAEISNIGSASIEQIDLTGKDVTIIKKEMFEGFHK